MLLTVGAFLLTVKLLCLQFLRRLLDALSHDKQKNSILSTKPQNVSEKAPIVSKKAKTVSCKYKSSTASRKLPIVSKKAVSRGKSPKNRDLFLPNP